MAWLCQGLTDNLTSQVSCEYPAYTSLKFSANTNIANIFNFIPSPLHALFATTVQPRLETVDDTHENMASVLAI